LNYSENNEIFVGGGCFLAALGSPSTLSLCLNCTWNSYHLL